jgi:DNA topoisomerase-2
LPELKPYYKGFKGTIEQGETSSQWLIKGTIERKGINKLLITEIPITYDLKSYIDILDDLEEKKIIQGYKDKSEDDNFLFEVIIASKTLADWDDEMLLSKLKLIKKVSENYTCMNENNKIEVFDDIYDIIKRYIKIKLNFLNRRKDYLIKSIEDDIRLDFSKYTFIKKIVDEDLIISKRKKSDIEIDLEKIPNIIKKEDSFDYLLNMNLLSLTEERMKKLEDDIKSKKISLDKLKETEIKDIWIDELSKI